MSFKRYPKYKASGLEWLGDVPDGWLIERSDAHLSNSRTQLDPKDFKGQDVFHYSIPIVQEIGTGQIEDGTEIASSKQVITKKVVLVSKLNPRKATICIAEPNSILTLCSPEFVALEPIKVKIEYLNYLALTEAFRQSLESKVTSVTKSHQRANPSDIYRFWNAWPSLVEQTAIAEFLELETAKISELVLVQQQLIEQLKEKRQAIISHVVTKGLNPHAPMKPSGTEWLDKVPEHWKVRRLKEVGVLKGGAGFPPDMQDVADEELPFYKVGDLKASTDGRLMAAPEHTVSKEIALKLRAAIIPIGSILYAKIGAALSLNRRRVTFCNCCIDNNMTAYTPQKKFIQTNWAFYWLSILDFGTFKNPGAVPSLSEGDQGVLPILVPPLAEQIQITDFLAKETGNIDELVAEAQKVIDLLHERRRALISVAVTGQIDVRHLAGV